MSELRGEAVAGLSYDEVNAIHKARVVSTSCLDILVEHMGTHPLLDGEVKGRVSIVE